MKFTTYNRYTTKIIAIILSFILGILVAVGAEAGIAYYYLTKQGTLKQLEQVAQNRNIAVDFGEDIENETILNWGKEVAGLVTNLSSKEIGNIEKIIGLQLISDNINKMLGIEKTIIQGSTLENLGETISGNLTMSIAQDKFGIEFPDMPLFNDETFLAKTLDTAFGDLADQPLNKVLAIDENSNKALQSLANIPINQLGGEAGDEAISQNCLCDFMDITESSSQTLQTLKYCTLKSYYQYEEDGVTIKLDEFGNKMYETKEITEGETTITIPLMGVADKVDLMKVSEVIAIDESSHAILRKMRVAEGTEDPALFGSEDLLVTELGGQKFTDLINGTKIGEIVDIDETSEPIMIALQDTSIEGLNDKIAILQLNEIFDDTQLTSGALSLIAPDTQLNNIPSAMTTAVQDCTIITLKEKGLIDSSSFTNIGNMRKQQQSYVYNSTLSGVIGGLIGFVSDVQGGNILGANDNIEFESITLTNASFSSLTSFVAAINPNETYSNVSSSNASIAITIDPVADAQFYNSVDDTYYIPVFNLDQDITFDFGSETVKMAVMIKDVTNYTLSSYQYAYYYGPNAMHSIDQIGTLTYSQQT